MHRTYNGRFQSPPEPKGGGKWIAIGCLLIPFWSVPVVGIVASICCFVKGGKMNGVKRMYNRFHEFCAIIGTRQRIPLRELGRAAEMDKNEIRKYLQKMIAQGYFGADACLDINRDELILPPMPGQSVEQPTAGWKDAVFELLNALRAERYKSVMPNGYQHAEEARARAEEVKARAEETRARAEEMRARKQSEKKDRMDSAQPRHAAAKQPAQEKPGYMGELERTLNELHALNERIDDAGVSERIDRIGMVTAGIFRAVIDKPEREQDVRKFMNYYLPTTLKLLKSYEMLEDQSYQGENIAASRKKIEDVLDLLISAFEKQLDRLFTNDALDIATDIDVLETMMAGDGLSDKGSMRMTL